MFALTSMCVSTLYARRLTSLHVTRRAIFAAMVCQGVSLALAFTQDYRSPAWLADVGSAQAWLLCCVLAALQGLVDALSINASNATISIQYEQALVPGGFAMSMAMRGLGQFLMFLAAALIGYDFQRVMFAIIVSAALFSMIVLLHSRNEARLSEQLSWTALVQDAKSAPKAIPEAIVADFEALKAALGRCRRRGVYQEYSDEADG
jgi:MFS family permease